MQQKQQPKLKIDKQKREEKVDINELYGKDSFTKAYEYKKQKNIDIQKGLNKEQILQAKAKNGTNEISQGKEKKWYHYFANSLFSPFNLILLGITGVLTYTDVYLSSPPSYANIIVILALITVSTLLEFFEVYSSNKAA